MTAISKAFVTIADGVVDPASPLDTVLMTGLRDCTIHLREWLGASFYGGAQQDHSHNGVDSFLVRIGPNLARNGSFEDGEGNWTITDYSGGSHAISTSTRHHGEKSLSFTSTVLANGGGDAIMNEYVPCSELFAILVQVIRSASGANISSKAEVIWYDATKAQISASTVYSDTNTPTSATWAKVRVAPPANARFFRIKLTGGVPAVGASTGTIFFDGVIVSDWTLNEAYIDAAWTQAAIGSGAVGQAQLKTTTGSQSGNVNGSATAAITLTGRTYSLWQLGGDDPNTGAAGPFAWGSGNVSAGVLGIYNTGSISSNWSLDERYVQASPPYNLGAGYIPLFVTAVVDGLGKLCAISVAPDPVWAYHGPTNICPERIDAAGRGFRRYREIAG